MANVTEISVDNGSMLGAYGYVILGFLFGLANLLVGLSVLKYSALRCFNRYVLLMALALADAGYLLGTFAGGVYRIWLFKSGRIAERLTPLQCLLTPQMLLWYTVYPLSSLMLVVLSLDRLLMVSFPSFYVLSLPSPMYANSVVFSCLVLMFGMASVAVVHVRMRPAHITVTVNGSPFVEYAHRLDPNKIEAISVEGDIFDQQVLVDPPPST